MSSELRAPSQVPTNKLYINAGDLRSTIYDANSSTLSGTSGWVSTFAGALSTSFSAVFRDMGKTVYIPAGSVGASVSSVLRKVQLVTNSGVGTGDDGTGGYYTGYIQLGGVTYGGGLGLTNAGSPTQNAGVSKVVRLN